MDSVLDGPDAGNASAEGCLPREAVVHSRSLRMWTAGCPSVRGRSPHVRRCSRTPQWLALRLRSGSGPRRLLQLSCTRRERTPRRSLARRLQLPCIDDVIISGNPGDRAKRCKLALSSLSTGPRDLLELLLNGSGQREVRSGRMTPDERWADRDPSFPWKIVHRF
ncbi:hypothetical protein KFL_014000010 [Klebsormidium nitens]|uniref:Uncharacterized protein n=1 Tax=Klebsormidium nitens TaxID=105231 RepID=A0A1Y1IT47_KLENI|nr:hypothetical protein KFL_014000010 [Klebsormidium nitens]|eukprot:GAQ93262.1 hypothetical protein KFL_014000010 [Klebsormidium nitens]